MIEEILNHSMECIKVIRRAENVDVNSSLYESYVKKAEGHLKYLKEESPMLYGILFSEYNKLHHGSFKVVEDKNG